MAFGPEVLAALDLECPSRSDGGAPMAFGRGRVRRSDGKARTGNSHTLPPAGVLGAFMPAVYKAANDNFQ